MAALAPHTGHAQIVGITGSPGVGKSTSTAALVGVLRAAGQARRRSGRRPVVAVLRRCAARRPGADAGPRARPRGLHPVDGLARAPRRAGLDDAAGAAGARRRRLRRDADRDGRRRPERGRDRRAGRHHARAARAGDGRRHPGGQGRDPRDRRPLRHQQGRPRRRRHAAARAALDARAGRARPRATGGRRSSRPSPPRATASTRWSPRSTGTTTGWSRPASSPSGVPDVRATRSRRSRSPRCASGGATCTAAPSSTTSPPQVAAGESDPYAAAETLLAEI